MHIEVLLCGRRNEHAQACVYEDGREDAHGPELTSNMYGGHGDEITHCAQRDQCAFTSFVMRHFTVEDAEESNKEILTRVGAGAVETYVRRYGLEHLLGLSDVADGGRAKREMDLVLGAVPHVQPMHSI